MRNRIPVCKCKSGYKKGNDSTKCLGKRKSIFTIRIELSISIRHFFKSLINLLGDNLFANTNCHKEVLFIFVYLGNRLMCNISIWCGDFLFKCWLLHLVVINIFILNTIIDMLTLVVMLCHIPASHQAVLAIWQSEQGKWLSCTLSHATIWHQNMSRAHGLLASLQHMLH